MLTSYLTLESAPLRDALLQIEVNHHGIILTASVTGAVTGIATDGDIRTNQFLCRKKGLVNEMQQVKPDALLAVQAGLVRGE